jgi:hypothetical protein
MDVFGTNTRDASTRENQKPDGNIGFQSLPGTLHEIAVFAALFKLTVGGY